jgi:His-Xaa-Ser system protein HxsD
LEKLNALGNIEIDEKEGFAVFSVNAGIYDDKIVSSAAYIMLDKAFIILDGDPKTTIKVEIRKKKPEQDIKKLVEEFNDELLNYKVYHTQSEKNKNIREMILQRVLMTNNPEYFEDKKEKEEAVEDPEKISKKWDESKQC